ncbi:MAG TPA: hypothetical protein DCP61_07490, partial [Treponema sp.]|nr:hypothetical protein [Treponema sp.]
NIKLEVCPIKEKFMGLISDLFFDKSPSPLGVTKKTMKTKSTVKTKMPTTNLTMTALTKTRTFRFCR